MKDKVYINIKGLQLEPQDASNEGNLNAEKTEKIEVIHCGNYAVVNGKEYIRFDEVYEGEEKKCSNMIKIADNSIELTKKGAVTAHLSFVQGQKTMTCYETPYGNLYFGVFTRSVQIERSEEKITIDVDYALELNYEQLSDCQVSIEISSGKFNMLE
jgi:uncharacterized beta-barrel protein YwiB (DUF1934 family)